MPRSMSDAVVFDVLRRVPLFADTPVDELRAVARAAHTFWRQKGASVFEEGGRADGCLVLTSGRAKVVLSGARDSEIILGIVQPYAVLGEMALLDDSTRSAGLVAIEKSHFIGIDRATFLELRKNRAFEDRLVRHVTALLRRATERLRAIYTYSSTERLAWCLATLARQRGERLGSEIAISPRPPHHELAEMTGCARETVSRSLVRLRRMKWVSWDRHSLRLHASVVSRYAGDIASAL